VFISESCSPKVHAINFRFTRTTKRLRPVTAKRIYPQRAINYHKILGYSRGTVNGQLFRCFLLPSWQIRRQSYQPPLLDEVFSLLQVSRHIYTSGIPEQLSISVYVHTMADSHARLRPRLLPTFKA